MISNFLIIEFFPYLLSAGGGGSMKTDGIAVSEAGVGIGGGAGGGAINTDEYYGNFNVHTSNV